MSIPRVSLLGTGDLTYFEKEINVGLWVEDSRAGGALMKFSGF
ncbi:MAG: hypothetical protein R3D66_05850 [Alphaproteobacteria bacterium]